MHACNNFVFLLEHLNIEFFLMKFLKNHNLNFRVYFNCIFTFVISNKLDMNNIHYKNYKVLFTNPSARAGYDTRSIFKQSLTGLNSEFSFS